MTSCRAVHPEFPEYVCLKQAHGKDHAHSNGQGISWTEQSAYVPDQAAVDWARAAVLRSIEKYRRFEQESLRDGRKEAARQWRVVARSMEMDLIGGGCVIGPFHERAVQVQEMMDDASRARS